MRLAKHTLLVLAVLLTYASCKKSGSSASNGSGKTDSTTTGGTGTTGTNGCLLSDRLHTGLDYLYSYNPDKTLSGIAVQQTFSYPWTAAFSYSGDSTVIVEKDGNQPGTKYTVTITKNAQGLVANMFYESFAVGGVPITWTNFAFEYSGQNPSQCTMTVDGLNGIAFFNYTYANGNLASISEGPGTTFSLYPHALGFTYDQNTPVVPDDIFWEDSQVGSWSGYYVNGIYNALYPVQNKNIVIAQTTTDSLVHQSSVYYTFDNNKNIIFSKITDPSTKIADSVTYRYNCSN